MRRRPDPPFVVVGHIVRPHGVKGEMLVRSLTDRPGSTYDPGTEMRIGDAAGEQPDEFFPPMRIAEVRPFRGQGSYLVRFEGVEDRDQAGFLHDRYLLRPFSEVEPAGEDELFYHELLGLSVSTREGRELGEVREVYPLEPAELLEVSDGRREYLIPYSREIVIEVDAEAGRIVVDPPEGLLDL